MSRDAMRYRVLGLYAHYLEQSRDGRLIRPQSEYIGPVGRRDNRMPAAPAA